MINYNYDNQTIAEKEQINSEVNNKVASIEALVKKLDMGINDNTNELNYVRKNLLRGYTHPYNEVCKLDKLYPMGDDIVVESSKLMKTMLNERRHTVSEIAIIVHYIEDGRYNKETIEILDDLYETMSNAVNELEDMNNSAKEINSQFYGLLLDSGFESDKTKLVNEFIRKTECFAPEIDMDIYRFDEENTNFDEKVSAVEYEVSKVKDRLLSVKDVCSYIKNNNIDSKEYDELRLLNKTIDDNMRIGSDKLYRVKELSSSVIAMMENADSLEESQLLLVKAKNRKALSNKKLIELMQFTVRIESLYKNMFKLKDLMNELSELYDSIFKDISTIDTLVKELSKKETEYNQILN